MKDIPDIIGAPEAGFLRLLFANLNNAALYYAVMRNYESLPGGLAGSDLDLIIQPGDEQAVRQIIDHAIQQAHGAAIGYSSSLGFFKAFAFGRNPAHNMRWWGARIDVNVGYGFKGNAVVDLVACKVYQAIYQDIQVLELGFAAVLGVLKEVLNNNRMPERYRPAARQAVREDWPRLRLALAPMGEQGLVLFRQLMMVDNLPVELTKPAQELRRAMHWFAFKHAPFQFVRNRFLHELSKVQRYWRASGVMVAVLGTDGVGKSTVINAIKPVLNDATHGALEIKHLRPGLLPPLARLKGKQPVQMGPVLNPHGSTSSGKVGSFFRLTYLTLDYVLGYWLLLRPKIAKSPTVILFDRYCYDIAIDPRRFRINLNQSVIAWFIRWIPKPDIVLCLYADPDVILMRKQELPLAEVIRQVNALREFAQQESRAILVSTEGTIEEVRNQVMNGMCSFLNKLKN